MSETLARTPLYDLHAELGARLVPFAGWEMPVQYTGIIEEHMAVRKAAGLFDVSHMGEARIRGRDAAAFLDRIMTNELSTLKPGAARYTLMCQPDGGCVDDLIVYRFSETEFLICLNASNAQKDIAWMRSLIGTAKVEVLDECAAWAQLAIQGPLAEQILALTTALPLASIRRFGFLVGEFGGIPFLVRGFRRNQGIFRVLAGVCVVARRGRQPGRARGQPGEHIAGKVHAQQHPADGQPAQFPAGQPGAAVPEPVIEGSGELPYKRAGCCCVNACGR
mgnify:CR=1 FL=1